MKPQLHFAHGNGFPALCYTQMLNALSEHFACYYVDRLGHNPQFPVTENWSYLVDEVINSIVQQCNEPVIAVGHSLGGVLSLLAAIQRPELFKAVIMLDSPLLGRLKSNMVKLAKTLGLIDRLTPAHRTRGRRQRWQNKEQLIAYLRERPLFKTFSEACLEDYINYGLKKEEAGYQLRFDSHIEYLIYRTIPHQLHHYAGKLKVPAALIYGTQSSVVDRFDVRYMKHHFNIQCFKIKGTHMFPMENPQMTAACIMQRLEHIMREKISN